MISMILKNILKSGRKNLFFSIFVVSLMYCLSLFLLSDNFKLAVIVSVIFSGIYYLLTQKLFISLLLPFTISGFFIVPAKSYTFLYATRSEYIHELHPNGIFETISLTISDIFSMVIFVYIIRARLSAAFTRNRNLFINTLNTPIVMGILVTWILYFSLSIFISLYNSEFVFFSLNLIAQYGKMVVIFLAILLLISEYSEYINLFIASLLSLLFFQSILGIMQFIQSVTFSGASMLKHSIDDEEKSGLSRITGIFLSGNSHAFSIMILTILTAPVIMIRNSLWRIILFLGILNIIISQSRSAWISCICVLIFLFFKYRNRLSKLMKLGSFRTISILLLVIFFSFTFFIIPRIQASSIFFGQDGGGTLRIQMIKEGWQLIQNSPWTGYGSGMSVRAFIENIPNGYIYTFPFPVHNAYLLLALDSGIPSAILFFFPIVLVLLLSHRNQRNMRLQEERVSSIVCAIIAICTYFLAQLVDGRREFIYIGIVLGLGIAYSINIFKENKYEY